MGKSAKGRQGKKSIEPKAPLFWKKYSIYAFSDLDGSLTEELLDITDHYTDQYEEHLNFLSKKTSWYKNKTNISDDIISFLDRLKAANLTVEEFRKLFQDEILIDVLDGGIISAGCDEHCFYTYWGPNLYLRHKLSETILGNYPLLASGAKEELRVSSEVFDTFFADCYKHIYISSWKLSLLEEILIERSQFLSP